MMENKMDFDNIHPALRGFTVFYQQRLKDRIQKDLSRYKNEKKRSSFIMVIGFLTLFLWLWLFFTPLYELFALLPILLMVIHILLFLILPIRGMDALQREIKPFVYAKVAEFLHMTYDEQARDFPIEPFHESAILPCDTECQLKDAFYGEQNGIPYATASCHILGKKNRNDRTAYEISQHRAVLFSYQVHTDIQGVVIIASRADASERLFRTLKGKTLQHSYPYESVNVRAPTFDKQYSVYASHPSCAVSLLDNRLRKKLIRLSNEPLVFEDDVDALHIAYRPDGILVKIMAAKPYYEAAQRFGKKEEQTYVANVLEEIIKGFVIKDFLIG